MSDLAEMIESIDNYGKIEETPITPVATEDNVKNITDFAKRYATLEKQIKTIKADIKELKHEFDRSFHWLRPWMSVITSTDPDHLDIYGTKEAYLESFRRR